MKTSHNLEILGHKHIFFKYLANISWISQRSRSIVSLKRSTILSLVRSRKYMVSHSTSAEDQLLLTTSPIFNAADIPRRTQDVTLQQSFWCLTLLIISKYKTWNILLGGLVLFKANCSFEGFGCRNMNNHSKKAWPCRSLSKASQFDPMVYDESWLMQHLSIWVWICL